MIAENLWGLLRLKSKCCGGDSLAKAASRLGWISFWIQIVIGSFPVLLVVNLNRGIGTRGGSAD
jgi:hypothetical protein